MNNWRISSTRRGKALFWAVLTALTLLTALGSLWFGSVPVSPVEVLSALLGRGGPRAAGLFLVCYLLGCALSILVVGRTGLMALLSERE